MKKVKIGIIGTGVGIRTHLSGFRLVRNAEVVAICGSSLERSKQFAEKFDIPIACKDYKELCDMEDIDLVCVTTPNKLHYEMVKYAMSKHKHIICEKPLSDDEKQVDELISLAKNYDKLCLVDHQLRFNPYIKKIKELIEFGELGKVYSVQINQQGSGFANENAKWSWSFDGSQGGGVRLAMTSHFNDLMQFWFNSREVQSVSGYLNPVTKERKDNDGKTQNVVASTMCFAQIQFDDELVCEYSINAGSYMKSRFDIHIFGDKGELTFSLQDKLYLYKRTDVGNMQKVELEDVFDDEKENKVSIFSGSFRYFAPLVVDAILNNDFEKIKDCATFADAKYNIQILDAIQKSANSVKAVTFQTIKNNYV